MRSLAQSERIDQLLSGEDPPAVRLRVDFTSDDSAENVLGRTRQVMRLVAEGQDDNWPADDAWRKRLPEWFCDSFEGHTMKELLSRSDLWDFGSWLDAMASPGWEWWSCSTSDGRGVIRIAAHSDPFSIEPLMYLLRAAGATSVDFSEE